MRKIGGRQRGRQINIERIISWLQADNDEQAMQWSPWNNSLLHREMMGGGEGFKRERAHSTIMTANERVIDKER